MALPAGGTVEYDWGDATTTVVPVSSGQAGASHRFGWRGKFGVRTTIKDAAGEVVGVDHDTYEYDYSYVPPPPYEVHSVTPSTGPVAGGTSAFSQAWA